jgi:hypothetical protein
MLNLLNAKLLKLLSQDRLKKKHKKKELCKIANDVFLVAFQPRSPFFQHPLIAQTASKTDMT